MSVNGHKECYGTMVADTMHPATDRVMPGKIFHFELKTTGGMYPGRRIVRTKLSGWDDRITCEAFDNCFKLSLIKLTAEGVIAKR